MWTKKNILLSYCRHLFVVVVIVVGVILLKKSMLMVHTSGIFFALFRPQRWFNH